MDDVIGSQYENESQAQKNDGTDFNRKDETTKGSKFENFTNPTDRPVIKGAESDDCDEQTHYGCTLQMKSPPENLVIQRDRNNDEVKDTGFHISAEEPASNAEARDADFDILGGQELGNGDKQSLNANTEVGNSRCNTQTKLNADSESSEVETDKTENVAKKNEMFTENRDENKTESVNSEERERMVDEGTELSKDEQKDYSTLSTTTHRQNEIERENEIEENNKSDDCDEQSHYGCTIQMKSPPENLVIHRDRNKDEAKDTEFHISAEEPSTSAAPHNADEQSTISDTGIDILGEQENGDKQSLNANTEVGNSRCNTQTKLNAGSESSEIEKDKTENVAEKNEMFTENRDENIIESVNSEERERMVDEGTELSKDENRDYSTLSTATHRQNEIERESEIEENNKSDDCDEQTHYGCTIQMKCTPENLVIHRDRNKNEVKDTEFHISAEEPSSNAEARDADFDILGGQELGNGDKQSLNAKTEVGNSRCNTQIKLIADSGSSEVETDKTENVAEKNEIFMENRDGNKTESVNSEERERMIDKGTELSKDEQKDYSTSSTASHKQNYTEKEGKMTPIEENNVVRGLSEYPIREAQISDDPGDFQDSKFKNQLKEFCEEKKAVTCWTNNTTSSISTPKEKPFKDSQVMSSLKAGVEYKFSSSASCSKQKLKPLAAVTNASRVKYGHCFKTFPLDLEVLSSKENKAQHSIVQSQSKNASKMSCRMCSRWCLYWNICKECMTFLCDSCMDLYHPPTLLHATFRAKSFSDFGCLDHIMIFQYFCCDCNRRRCEECVESSKCKDHVLMDIFTNSDYIKNESGKQEVQATTKMLSKGTISKNKKLAQSEVVFSKEDDDLRDNCCKYCRMTYERYNICEDCMVYFCDDCLKRFHPATHTICKSKPFLVFACPDHKQICRHFCEVCKARKCDDCIAKKGKCSGHQIIQLLKHISQQKDNFDETIHRFSSTSSQTINVLEEELDKTESAISINYLLRKETLRQEFASFHHLMTEREQQMHRDLEEEYKAHLIKIRQRRRQYGSYLVEDSKFLSKSLHTLGKESLLSFYFSGQTIWKRFKKHRRELECLESPDDISVSTFRPPFSLYVEKTELAKSLQMRTSESFNLTCPRNTVYLDDVTKPLRVQDFVNIPSSTLSSSWTISVEIRESVRKAIWRTECCSEDECIANTKSKVFLEPKSRYLIKFYLQTTTRVSESKSTQNRSKPCHVLLVTGNEASMDTSSDVGYLYRTRIVGLEISSKERSGLLRTSMCLKFTSNPFLSTPWYEQFSFEERRFYSNLEKEKKVENEAETYQTSIVGLINTERSSSPTSKLSRYNLNPYSQHLPTQLVTQLQDEELSLEERRFYFNLEKNKKVENKIKAA